MGELTRLTGHDREDARRAAAHIIDAVVHGRGDPAGTLIAQAKHLGVPVEVLVLWLAQLASEAS